MENTFSLFISRIMERVKSRFKEERYAHYKYLWNEIARSICHDPHSFRNLEERVIPSFDFTEDFFLSLEESLPIIKRLFLEKKSRGVSFSWFRFPRFLHPESQELFLDKILPIFGSENAIIAADKCAYEVSEKFITKILTNSKIKLRVDFPTFRDDSSEGDSSENRKYNTLLYDKSIGNPLNMNLFMEGRRSDYTPLESLTSSFRNIAYRDSPTLLLSEK